MRGDWDDWSAQGFDDGESMPVDGNQDPESTGFQDGGDSFVVIDDNEDDL